MEYNQANPQPNTPPEANPPQIADERPGRSFDHKVLVAFLILFVVGLLMLLAHLFTQVQQLRQQIEVVEIKESEANSQVSRDTNNSTAIADNSTEGWREYADDDILFKYPADLYALKDPRNQDSETYTHVSLLLNEAVAHEYQTCLKNSKNDIYLDWEGGCDVGRVVYSYSIYVAKKPHLLEDTLTQKYKQSEKPPYQIHNFVDLKQRAWVVEDSIWGMGDSSSAEADTFIDGNYFLINIRTHARALEVYQNQIMMIRDGDASNATPMIDHLDKFIRQTLSTLEFTKTTDMQKHTLSLVRNSDFQLGKEFTVEYETPAGWVTKEKIVKNMDKNLYDSCVEHTLTHTSSGTVLSITPICEGKSYENIPYPEDAIIVADRDSKGSDDGAHVAWFRTKTNKNNYIYRTRLDDPILGSRTVYDDIVVTHDNYQPHTGVFTKVTLTLQDKGGNNTDIIKEADAIVASLRLI